MKQQSISTKSLILSIPYFILVFLISSVDYEARLSSLTHNFSLFGFFTREPIFLLELYFLNIFLGEPAVAIARLINIYVSVLFILILSRKDQLSKKKELLLIFNPISFFLIFNINAQLMATLFCYWVYRNHNNSFIVSFMAPLFHLIGLIAVGLYFFRKSYFLVPLSMLLLVYFVFGRELTTFFQLFNFIIIKLSDYSTYETNILHTIFTFTLIFFSFFILFIMQKASMRFFTFFLSVFFLSFLSIDYKFFSRIIFSFEFLLIYEIILNYGISLRRKSGLILKTV